MPAPGIWFSCARTGLAQNERTGKNTLQSRTAEYFQLLEIDDRAALECELDCIVEDAIQQALANPTHGILVTRHGPGTFTIELSKEVSPGLIGERDLTKT